MLAQATLQQTEFVAENRRSLFGFFVSGILISFLGAVLPAWGYHVDPNFVTIGYYFLSLNLGILAGVRLAHVMLSRKGISDFYDSANASRHTARRIVRGHACRGTC